MPKIDERRWPTALEATYLVKITLHSCPFIKPCTILGEYFCKCCGNVYDLSTPPGVYSAAVCTIKISTVQVSNLWSGSHISAVFVDIPHCRGTFLPGLINRKRETGTEIAIWTMSRHRCRCHRAPSDIGPGHHILRRSTVAGEGLFMPAFLRCNLRPFPGTSVPSASLRSDINTRMRNSKFLVHLLPLVPPRKHPNDTKILRSNSILSHGMRTLYIDWADAVWWSRINYFVKHLI